MNLKKTKTKNNPSKQLEQEQNHRNGDHMEGSQWGGGGRRIGGKGTGNKKHVKNSIGNGEPKELICTTHGHELRGAECWRVGRYRAEG